MGKNFKLEYEVSASDFLDRLLGRETGAGARIRPINRDEYRYVLNGKACVIHAEMLMGTPGRAIDYTSFEAWTDGTPIPAELRAEVVRDFENYLRSVGETYSG